MVINFPDQHFITCTNVKIHSFNIPVQEFLCRFQLIECTPLCYEQQKRFNIHRHSSSALSLLSVI